MEIARSAVALGLFDGVHIGHRAVLSAACGQCGKGLVPEVFTFSPESAAYKPDSDSGYIYGADTKNRLIRECGIKNICFPPFEKVCGLSGEEFVRRVLRERLNAAYVCCGRDFRFGSRASCGISELRELGRKYRFEIAVVDDVRSGENVVSSSGIRRLLRDGNIVKANELLGHSYIVSGTVVDGNHIGRTLDFPTINQDFAEGQLVPAYGVYSGKLSLDGEVFRTVTNIGVKPTIAGERRPLAETHIIGFSGDLYGRSLDVCLEHFIRGEKRFESLDELRAQIKEDIRSAGNDI